MSREKTRCPKCGKFLTPYIKTSDLCQSCYRKLLEEYSYYDYKPNVKKPKPKSKAYKILQCVVNDRLSTEEISKLTNSNLVYVRLMIHRYLYKCDINGNPRPNYMGE